MAGSKTFKYVLPRLRSGEFPRLDKLKSDRIRVSIDASEGVLISGNKQGLLYLAKHLIAMGLIKDKTGLHVHLNPETDSLDEGSVEVTIDNIDFLASRRR
jgi:hypothetical protein